MRTEFYYVLFNNCHLFLNIDFVFDSSFFNIKKFCTLEEALNYNSLYFNNTLSVFKLSFKIDYSSSCLYDESLWYGVNDHFE